MPFINSTPANEIPHSSIVVGYCSLMLNRTCMFLQHAVLGGYDNHYTLQVLMSLFDDLLSDDRQTEWMELQQVSKKTQQPS